MLGWLALALVGGYPEPSGERVERHLAAMGTSLSVQVWAARRDEALAASEAVVRAIEAAEQRLSTWQEGGELMALNRQGSGAAALSTTLAGELEQALACAELTHGAFDPTVGALVMAWGLRSGGRIPSEEELSALLEPGGYRRVRLSAGRITRPSALAFEEGGFGKGAALDAAARALDHSSAHAALVDLGGQLLRWGDLSATWIAVSHPQKRDEKVAEVLAKETSVATSGNSERGLVVGGVSVGHILDPRTGKPAPDFGSVTVWADGGLLADCLSTGLYVLGPDAGLALAEQLPHVEALVVDVRAGAAALRATSGLVVRSSDGAAQAVVR